MKLSRKSIWARLILIPLALALLLPAAAQSSPAPEADEHHLTQEQAKELFRSVDHLLQFASEHTGLPIRHPVKKKLATREEVASYVAKRLKEQGSGERFEREARPLKKLGLLPRDFDLRQYMLGLYKEQVEGWYDSHNKTVYLLDWVAPDEQKPVMAHELVHALQDQNFGLEKWLDVAKDSKDDSTQIAIEEQRAARQAVVEGQAMLVLFEYELAPTGQSIASAPDAVDAMRASVLDEQGSTPMYAHAPLYLRESLLFPYTYGTDFERTLLLQRGKQAAFAGVFEHPPADTRQIMQPATYLVALTKGQPNEAAPQTRVVPLDSVLGPPWRQEDCDGIGEIDLHVLLRQWSGEAEADKLSPAWRGGYYVSLTRKDAPKDAPLSLALILQFDSAGSARQFAGIYQDALPKRYESLQRVVLQPASAQSGAPAETTREWSSDEGQLFLYVDGATVIALESFTPAEAAKLHAALVPAAQ